MSWNQPRTYYGAICRGGHHISEWVVDPGSHLAYQPTEDVVQEVDPFCADCGAPVLFQCPSCDQPLAGFRGGLGMPEVDQFCRRCGNQFPWTSREAMVLRLQDQLNNEPLDDHARLEAKEALAVLTASDDSADPAAKQRALAKLRGLASATWWKVAMPMMSALVTAELRKEMGLPAS